MTIRTSEVFLVSLLVALGASVATVIAASLLGTDRLIVAVPWGVIAGGAIGAVAAMIQHITGFSYLEVEEEE